MDRLQEAIAAIKAGNKTTGGRLLAEIVRQDPRNEQAWMWLAMAVKNPDQRQDCLERVLAINPRNWRAKKELKKLGVLPAVLPSQKRVIIKPDVDWSNKLQLVGQALTQIGIWLIILGIVVPCCVIICLALLSNNQ